MPQTLHIKPEPRAGRPAKRAPAPRLNRDGWLDAAFDAVVDGGFDKLRVLAIADGLGATRGSIYWYFDDHAALMGALVQRWRQREIDVNRALLVAATADAKADLLHLLDLALARGGDDLKDMRFELALRGLGRRDAAVAKLLAEVDAARLALFEAKFKRLGTEPKAAADLAALFYLAVTVGIQAIARPTRSAQLASCIRGLIADQLIEPRPVSRAPRPRAWVAAAAARGAFGSRPGLHDEPTGALREPTTGRQSGDHHRRGLGHRPRGGAIVRR
jgi:AcrR family transcriptional regulator